MSQVDFATVMASGSQRNSNNSGIGFFGLKNDKDEAIVRFMHDDVSTFDIFDLHTIKLGDKYRKINCLKPDIRSGAETCPLCARGDKLQRRIFIHMIEYKRDETGNYTASPVVWERAASGDNNYAVMLSNYINNYGVLSNYLFKVIRQGAAGNMNTTYAIVPVMDPNIANSPSFAKPETNPFDNYSPLGTIILNKSFEDVLTFTQTGTFPANTASNEESVTTVADAVNEFPTTPMQNTTPYTAPVPPSAPVNNFNTTPQAPWGVAPTRPVRGELNE